MEAFMSQMRLDKWLADAGAGTRSQVKEYLKKLDALRYIIRKNI